MKLLLKRIARRDKYTIGKLYIDGKYECDTVEDKDRGLTQNMSLEEIKKIKIPNETAIPTGTYKITLNVVSPISILAEDFLDYLMFLDTAVFSCILETRQSTPAAA